MLENNRLKRKNNDMKKTTLFLFLLFLSIGAMAKVEYNFEVIDIASKANEMLYSNAPCTDTRYGDQFTSWDVLFDENPATIFHSEYGTGTSVDGLDHYLRVDLGEGNELTTFKFTFTTRNQNCTVNSPTTIVVEGSNEANGTYTEIKTITGIPQENSYKYESEVLGNASNAYRYIRFRVTATGSNQTDGGGKKFFFISEFGMSKAIPFEVPVIEDFYSATTTFGTHQGPISNIINGDTSDKWWSNGNQAVGKTVTVTLNNVHQVDVIKWYFCGGDQPQGATIERRAVADGEWINVADFTINDIEDNIFTCTAGGKDVKELRLRITTEHSNWLQIAEVELWEYLVESSEPRRVSVFAGVGGSVSIEGETGTEVEVAGRVDIVATPDYGYEFVNWKKDEEIISTTASYVYNGEEDAEFVAEFRRLSIDEQYTKLSQPTFTQSDGNITEIAQIEFNDRNITGFSTTLGTTTRLNETIKVKAGETYNLTIGYELHWGDISLDQIDNNGTQTKYGPYLCEWEAGANPLNILKRDNDTMYEDFDLTSLDDFNVDTSGSDPYIWLPYEITIDEDHNFGDLVVVRLVVASENYVQGRCFDILLEVAQQHTLNVSAAGWASLYLDFPAAIPDFGDEDEEAGVYIVTGVKEDNWLNLVKVTEGVLPANTGVIVKAAQGTYEFKYSAEDAADVSANILKGTVKDEYIEGKAYVLGNKNGIGFYQAELNKNATGNDGTTHFKNNAYKSYLLASALAPTMQSNAGYRFAFGGTTAVEEVEMRNEKEEIYDLTGRRLSEITKPGIYIINGKKVIVR